MAKIAADEDVVYVSEEDEVELDDKDLTYTACATGNLKDLKRLIESNCPWHQDSAEVAYIQGHMELLTWALDNGATWTLESDEDEQGLDFNSAYSDEELSYTSDSEATDVSDSETACSEEALTCSGSDYSDSD